MTDSEVPSQKLLRPLPGQEFSVAGVDLWQWWKAAQESAIAAQIPLAEVDWVLQELAGIDRLSLRLESFKDRAEIPLSLSLSELYDLWQQRVQQRIPIQYLVGFTPWRQFVLQVSPAVLIPRPETECLIDLAVMAMKERLGDLGFSQDSKPIWADLGTGSGAIALGLATAFPDATIYAVDVSEAALAIARKNAATYHLTDRIQFHQGSWLEPLAYLKGKLWGIVSNPPYIPTAMIAELQPEVANHEPPLALNGGSDGLDAIRHLIATAPDYLQPGGILLFEMMAGQAIAVTQLLQQQGHYETIQIHPDLSGIQRFALAVRSRASG